MGKSYRNYSKVWKTPRRCFEKERLDRELKLVGEYGATTNRFSGAKRSEAAAAEPSGAHGADYDGARPGRCAVALSRAVAANARMRMWTLSRADCTGSGGWRLAWSASPLPVERVIALHRAGR